MSKATKIESITVDNVRGISHLNLVFKTPEMIGNKFHLLVAPNGFGKSSLAAAFDNLKPKSLKVQPALWHMEDPSHQPKLEIVYSDVDGQQTVKADHACNTIFKVFSVAVINSKVRPKAVAKNGYNRFAKPTASLIVEPIILVQKVPRRPTNKYSASHIKSAFGSAGKILPGISKFLKDHQFLRDVLALPDLHKFAQRKVWAKIDPIVEGIINQSGTTEALLAWTEQHELAALKAIPELVTLARLFERVMKDSEVQRFLAAYQLAKVYAADSKALTEYHDWYSYVGGKNRCKQLLADVNSNAQWIKVSVREKKGELIAEFPVATKMSNGQRDLLVFVAQLMKAEFELTGGRAILVIDEVFDYLDECNLLAAQFYLKRFVDRFKANGAEIFPLLLTHLNPEVFKHSFLGLGKKDIRKIHWLDKAVDVNRKVGIPAMVLKREDAEFKDVIGRYFFHYHPANCEKVDLFKKHGLKEKWGNSHAFYAYVFAEFDKYCKGEVDVDYVAVCVAARIAIEKQVFDQLEQDDQTRFTDEYVKGTVDKLDFVEQLGIVVPDSHRLLGLLYNDMLHHKDHYDYISPIVSKMKNPAIRSMMSQIKDASCFQAKRPH